jgi:hypothetical protein
MSDLRWLQLVAGIIERVEPDEAVRLDVHGKLKATVDYQAAYSQFQSGASERVLTMLIHGAIRRLT